MLHVMEENTVYPWERLDEGLCGQFSLLQINVHSHIINKGM